MASNKKYRINEMLNRLPMRKNMVALRMLPKILQVSQPTVYKWRSLTLEDAQDIPYQKVDMLEQFFSLAPGELKNYESPNIRSINDLSEDDLDEEIAGDNYGLSK